MLLKNNSPRLISINASNDEQDCIDLMPAGKPVNVPDKLCGTRYVKALLQSNSIVEVKGATEPDNPLDDMTVAELKSYADSENIEYGTSIKKDELKALIETNSK